MTAQIDVITGEKTVLDYLLKPILKARNEALREREKAGTSATSVPATARSAARPSCKAASQERLEAFYHAPARRRTAASLPRASRQHGMQTCTADPPTRYQDMRGCPANALSRHAPAPHQHAIKTCDGPASTTLGGNDPTSPPRLGNFARGPRVCYDERASSTRRRLEIGML
jgi:hypothetical protein